MNKNLYEYVRQGKDIFDSRADADIEKNRKGNFELVFRNKNGELINNLEVSIDMEQIDFNFGANIFMLGEYDDEEKNKKYEKYFCRIFNSATVPLYWEGTEPRQGYLRYDKDTKRDVYRRPPADAVAEFCKNHNLRMKGHPLFWHEFIPQWLPDDYNELKPLIEKRFAEISERYKDVFECFDVVNEPSRIYDVYMRDRNRGRKYILPEDDYCVWLFELAEKYFHDNKLIINDTVWASFTEFRGKYSGFYLNVKDLLGKGLKIDEIGLQCHCGGDGPENVYNAERLYNVLDTYASLGKTLNISEISIPSLFDDVTDEDLQAVLAKQLYKVCFSHGSVTGLTWWNLPDDGVLSTKRKAGDENLPSTALIDGNYNPKPAYKALDELINKEWQTHTFLKTANGKVSFRGFYGKYKLTVDFGGEKVEKTISLGKNSSGIREIFI